MDRDDHRQDSGRTALLDAGALQSIAEQALDRVPADGALSHGLGADQIADWMLNQIIPPWPVDVGDVCLGLTARKIMPMDALDVVIPATARRLGELWLSDDMPFADVTLASAQLMQIARNLEVDYGLMPPTSTTRLDLIVATCADEQHLLGPQILTSQLRRRGHKVRFMPGASTDQLSEAALAPKSRADAVLLSSASWATLDSSSELAEPILSQGADAPRIVLGGAVVATLTDLKTKTPVHWVTNDISAALDGLGSQHGN